MNPLPPPTTLDDARRQVRIRHLEQLSHANITLTPPPDDEETSLLPSCKILTQELKKWSQDHIKSIEDATLKNVLSGKDNIDWNCCFLAFMESITVYLRDWEKLHKAVQLYKSVKAGTSANGDLHKVHDLYEQSIEGIKEVAAVWGMEFMQICGYILKHAHQGHNDKNPKWNGPFCGAFFPKDHKQGVPYVGITFKGTDPKNIKDINVDSSFDPIQVDAKHLFGTVVSEGVYNALFGTFNNKDILSPFELILHALEDFVPKLQGEDKAEPLLHVTGHSLGGSYSSFCFAQFMMQNASLPGGARLGDLYNFGSPRVGQKAWSQAFYENLGGKFPGGAWRIVNDKDIVPQVPSLLRYKDKTGPFYHIDNGIQIFKQAKPTRIESERDGAGNVDIGLTRIEFVTKLAKEKYHYPLSYYHALEHALADQ
ncbi:lipase class 3 [Fusarium mexicanum]|uniref:Lipase class 3 n=1 Tax=Fusarium mexicanum TaxID=751941 RepID=A0A8H5IQL5_9HYPO|nr:lipase class 3 [Fusarium mexicanum]